MLAKLQIRAMPLNSAAIPLTTALYGAQIRLPGSSAE
jgi:hypothetical protein